MPKHHAPTREHTSVPAPDPRSPFVVDTRELGRRAGSLRPVVRSVPAPAGLGDEVIGVPAGSPIDLDLRLESVTEGVLVSGTVQAVLSGECGRCLEPLGAAEPARMSTGIVELFAYPASTTDETTGEDEASRLIDDLLDLEPLVRDAVILELPAPLCRPDCPGLCSGCGVRWDDLPVDHTHDVVDPRWAALGSVRDQLVEPTDRTDAIDPIGGPSSTGARR